MGIPDKGVKDVRERMDQSTEKDVIHVKSISEIPDGYDAARAAIQYIMDKFQ